MTWIGVHDAATRLGVSPRRVLQRIEAGDLPAARIGRQWAIDSHDLPLATPRRSRPLSERMAWALLALLAGERPAVSATELRRLRAYAHRLGSDPDSVSLLRTWAERRGDRTTWRVAEADRDELRSDDRVRRSGVDAPGSGIVSPVAEVYVAVAELDHLVDDYFLVPAGAAEANVVLHVVAQVPDITWPVLAADLAEHLGSRENARAAELIGLGTPAGGTT
ncbi:excisionase family DNA binding protein [Mumia flava]|uniref:Excisionase family DNA binding protein n=1 Tax=Mumia flava TaxID=1348852 RepID=A0A0B2BRG7_9ACTN|nr:helix-turn-helix domain-containing protein [Mumia flava]PJJ57477.1 excisionase family DNA binding protein [Mumia flava]